MGRRAGCVGVRWGVRGEGWRVRRGDESCTWWQAGPSGFRARVSPFLCSLHHLHSSPLSISSTWQIFFPYLSFLPPSAPSRTHATNCFLSYPNYFSLCCRFKVIYGARFVLHLSNSFFPPFLSYLFWTASARVVPSNLQPCVHPTLPAACSPSWVSSVTRDQHLSVFPFRFHID